MRLAAQADRAAAEASARLAKRFGIATAPVVLATEYRPFVIAHRNERIDLIRH